MAAAAPALGQYLDWAVDPAAKLCRNVLCGDEAGIVSKYLGETGILGRNFWRTRMGINMDSERDIEPSFFPFWTGPDPIDVAEGRDKLRRVCETFLPPCAVPARCSLQQLKDRGLPIDDHYPQKYMEAEAGPFCYVVMRREVIGRGLPLDRQVRILEKAGSPGLAVIAELGAVALANYRFDESRWLGDDTGLEGTCTYSRCRKIRPSDYAPPKIGGFTKSRGLGFDRSYSAFSFVGATPVWRF